MGFKDKKQYPCINYKRDFLNREDIRSHIEESVRTYNSQEYFKLYLLYGIGGIGKTALLEKVKELYSEVNNIVFIKFSDEKDYLRRLIDIRNHFELAPKFDYLFLNYWEMTKSEKLNEEYVKSLSKQFSRLAGEIDRFSNTISAIIPGFSYATDALKLGKDLWDLHNTKKLNSEFQDILSDAIIHPEKILRQLHKSLAEDIIDTSENYGENKPIFIFDNYKKELIDYDVEWLSDFIDYFDDGIFIVTSREKLDWIDDINENSDKVEVNELTTIPTKYVDEYLRKLKVEDRFIKLIIDKTQCIPIYLDMGIAIYFSLEKKEDFEIMIDKKDTLIKSFLNHLCEEEQKIVNILALIKIFNKEIYEQMLHLNHLDLSTFSFEDFTKRSLTIDIKNVDSYKINEVIANNIASITKEGQKRIYVEQYLEILVERCIFKILPHEILAYAVNAFKLCDNYFFNLSPKAIDYLFDLVLYMLDTCWIKEFYDQLKETRKNSSIKEILKFVHGCIERQTNIQAGLDLISQISIDKLLGSKHINTIICEKNYLISIKGGYLEAEKLFHDFYSNLKTFNKDERFYVKGTIYYSDMLMLRGKFKEALRLFTDMEDNPYFARDISRSTYYEVQKQAGHCYRFNMHLDRAIQKYENIFNYGTDGFEHIRLKAYRLTTLCESFCFFNPEIVSSIQIEAIEINEKIKNNNSLAKIYYSLGIINIHNKNYTKAAEYINQSITINNKTHYIAGNIFTMVAKAYLEYAQYGKISNETERDIFRTYENIYKIYEFLLLPIYIMKNDEDNLARIKESCQWIDFDYTTNKYRDFLRIISN